MTNANAMTAADKIAKIISVIESGKTVYISTALKATRITSRDLAKFANLGIPLLKASGNSMYMASGKNYVCIDFCRFTVEA